MGADVTKGTFPVPIAEDGAWIAHVRNIPAFTCDAVLALRSSVCVGPANGIDPVVWDTAEVHPPPVGLARQFAAHVATTELFGHQDALVGHYSATPEVIRSHGMEVPLRPSPWTDDLSEARAVLAKAGDRPCRPVRDDADERWVLLVVATGMATCLIERDAEGPPPPGLGFAFDRAEPAPQAGTGLERPRFMHGRLVAAMGRVEKRNLACQSHD